MNNSLSGISNIFAKLLLTVAALLIAGAGSPVQAQELNCQVEFNIEQVQTTNRSVFDALKTAVQEYMNENHFTNLQLATNERIDCRMFFTIKEYTDDHMAGDLQVQVSRPVYNTSYTTTLLNFKDNKIEFDYQEGMPLTFTNGLSLRFTILMKSVIMVSPLKGKTSETRGMMMSVEAVKALRVMRPREGGQSKRM